MSDGVRIGVDIDEKTWKQFREEVKQRRGGVRGHLKTEVENALKAYMLGGDATPIDIDARLQRIEAAVGAAGTDGGATIENADTHTHATVDPPDQRPPANAATDKKVAYLAAQVREEVAPTGEVREFPKKTLREIIVDEYGFRSDTAKRYEERLVDHFNLVDHPNYDVMYATEERRREIIQQAAEDQDQ